MTNYRPLIDGLTVKPSKIEGLGLFTLVDIERGVKLGQTHVIDYMTGEIIRTPLGGFINHSKHQIVNYLKMEDFHIFIQLKI